MLSINGQKENVSIDLTKDVVLEFEPMNDETPISVWLTGTTIGIKTMYEVGWYTPRSKITIPAAAFRNMNGVQNNIGFGGCYLQVSRASVDQAKDVSGVLSSVEFSNIVSDGKFIAVSTKPVFNKGIEVKGTEANSEFTVKKSNAIFSPAFSQMKNLGVMGFAAQGVTSFYDKKTKAVFGGGYQETTKYATFPKFDDAVWANILDKTYQDVMQILKQEFNVNVYPVEKITGSKAYQTSNSYTSAEENTTEEFSQSYKNTKLFLGKRPFSELTGNKSPEYKIMKETGANALLNFTLHLDLNFEGPKAFMVPSITYNISGDIIGEYYTTNYVSGTITGASYPLKNKQAISASDLENIVLNRSALMEAFKKSIQAIKAQEKANGDYEIVWDAMKK